MILPCSCPAIRIWRPFGSVYKTGDPDTSSDGLDGTVPGAKNGQNWRPELSLGVVGCHLDRGVPPNCALLDVVVGEISLSDLTLAPPAPPRIAGAAPCCDLPLDFPRIAGRPAPHTRRTTPRPGTRTTAAPLLPAPRARPLLSPRKVGDNALYKARGN